MKLPWLFDSIKDCAEVVLALYRYKDDAPDAVLAPTALAKGDDICR